MIVGEIMYINKISNSKRETFRQCGLKYKRRYVDYYEGDTPKNGDSLNFGQYIHKIFEEGITAGHIKDLHKLAEHHRSTYKISANYNKRIEECLNNFLLFNKKLTETVATEFEYEISIAEDIKVNGVIDRIVKGADGGYLVIDYKTSKREKTRYDLFSDPQLLGYCFAVSKLYNVPVGNITCAHYYPESNNLVNIKFSKAKIDGYLKSVIADVWKIRKMKKDDFKPSKNEYCDWCEYKSMCPEFCAPEDVTVRVMLAEERKEAKKLIVPQN